MKRLIVNGFILLVLGLLSPQTTRAQGITYLSNLGQASSGQLAVASNSWTAGDFRTGDNPNGYSLDFIRLSMADALANPSGFTATVYSATGTFGIYPGSSLATLSGSLNPVTAGIFSYTPVENLTLSPATRYFIVLTAETGVLDGAYQWDFTNTSISNPGDDWLLSIAAASSDGSSWDYLSGAFPQFAINATPIPEPGVLSLLGLSALGSLWHRRKA